jgi:hypothetical protein
MAGAKLREILESSIYQGDARNDQRATQSGPMRVLAMTTPGSLLRDL